MARIVIYDKETGRVKEIIPSANTPEYTKRDDVLINPDGPVGVPVEHLVVDKEGSLVEMNAGEKVELALEKDAAKLKADNDSIDNFSGVSVKEIVATILKLVGAKITAQDVSNQIKLDRSSKADVSESEIGLK